MLIEAKCTRCGDTFVPHTIELAELIHGERVDTGKECGGIGIVQGQWLTVQELADYPNLSKLRIKEMAQFERHGRDFPHCADPHCVWHYPEGVQTCPPYETA